MKIEMSDIQLGSNIEKEGSLTGWRSDYQSIRELLDRRYLDELRRYNDIVLRHGIADGRFLYEVKPDVHSNPFCDALRQLPMLCGGYGLRQCSVVVDGGRRVGFHMAYLNEGTGVVVDPTFGQFVDLDSAIRDNLGLFYQRVFEGDQSAGKRLGVYYMF